MNDPGDHYDRLKALITGTWGATPASSTLDLLQRTCRASVHQLSVTGAGISLMTAAGIRGACQASDPHSAHLEELQFTLGEGPCIDAFDLRHPVLVNDLTDEAMSRWPAYSPAAHDRGLHAVFAFPLQIGAARLGVLDLYRDRPGPLTPGQLRQAVQIGEITVAALLDQHEQRSTGPDAADIDDVVDGRAELFQAQGMVMVQLGVPIQDAMARLRAYAYAENRRLSEVARDVVDRRLHFGKDH